MEQLTVELHISMAEFEAWYAGVATTVQARDSQGRNVRFPARILRPFLRHEGIHGQFVIRFDTNRRFHSIDRIADK